LPLGEPGDSLAAVTKIDRLLTFASMFGVAAAALAACNAPHPNIREGDADSVQITYGGDVATAWPLARKHCAQYERVPRLADIGVSEGGGMVLANFDCVRP
jgi:hypothetical protein